MRQLLVGVAKSVRKKTRLRALRSGVPKVPNAAKLQAPPQARGQGATIAVARRGYGRRTFVFRIPALWETFGRRLTAVKTRRIKICSGASGWRG